MYHFTMPFKPLR
ncbi:Protein CBG25540 [Caenorhabditis briggsae]|uniref:Protein CBG25540 n=1 Tax=Caenorhabditis briggsae TaxID=6238 RepID=B6IIR2_CAEBR|nr:Protein CBG25540 [Caenorhabditis briggsae]CAR99792.1 Protein CBG25540 [Caenorhabditis briggsae]